MRHEVVASYVPELSRVISGIKKHGGVKGGDGGGMHSRGGRAELLLGGLSGE